MWPFKSKYDKLTREEVVDAICQLEKELKGIEDSLPETQKQIDDLMNKGKKEPDKQTIPLAGFYLSVRLLLTFSSSPIS